MEIEGPIGIETADIYLHFPCITRDEADELAEYLEEEYIEYEGATDIVIDLQAQLKKQKEIIEKAKSKMDSIFANGDNEKILEDLLKLNNILEDKEV